VHAWIVVHRIVLPMTLHCHWDGSVTACLTLWSVAKVLTVFVDHLQCNGSWSAHGDPVSCIPSECVRSLYCRASVGILGWVHLAVCSVLPAVQVRTSPDWNRPSPVQSSPLKFCTRIGLVHNICALVWNNLDWCGLRYPTAWFLDQIQAHLEVYVDWCVLLRNP